MAFLRSLIFVLPAMFLSGNAWASLITITDADFDPALNVNLSSLEWLSLTETENMSRVEVEAQLLTGGELEGWRYASLTDVQALFSSLGSWSPARLAENFAGVSAFFSAFGSGSAYDAGNNGYAANGFNIWNMFYGEVSGNNSQYGVVSIYDTDYFLAGNRTSTGLLDSAQFDGSSMRNVNSSSNNLGSLLVRDFQAPALVPVTGNQPQVKAPESASWVMLILASGMLLRRRAR